MLHTLYQGSGLMTGSLSTILWEHQAPKSSYLIPNKAKDESSCGRLERQASPKTIAGQ